MSYFSELEEGERPRERHEIDETLWGGIRALIRRCIADGSFGMTFPETCHDSGGPIGTDDKSIWQAMQAEFADLEEPPWYHGPQRTPRTLDALDLLQFCWRSVGRPIRGDYHAYFKHYHLTFDAQAGRDDFRDTVNRIFRRNGLVYELTEHGEIRRLAPLILRDALAIARFQTGDPRLDALLEKARKKFVSPNIEVRRESLEALWDAWERLKTLDGPDKKIHVTRMLDMASGPSSPKLRDAFERDAGELTWIGNNLQIRHTETDKEAVSQSAHVDYLFHRLFALITAILKARP